MKKAVFVLALIVFAAALWAGDDPVASWSLGGPAGGLEPVYWEEIRRDGRRRDFNYDLDVYDDEEEEDDEGAYYETEIEELYEED
ncbi:MAG: hypothetical protein J5758_04360, partial [Abditibacteriota bacterium]|nr:hypothetical protein [Abditibacteriota bacterium]